MVQGCYGQAEMHAVQYLTEITVTQRNKEDHNCETLQVSQLLVKHGLLELEVVLGNGSTVSRSLRFNADDINACVVQYWSCKYLRIMAVSHAVGKRAMCPVPYHLLPTAVIIEQIRESV